VPLFSLKPAAATADDPGWSGSLHRGPCHVAAPDAWRARLYAANAVADPEAARTQAGLLPAAPWTRPGLVVERLIGAGHGGTPEGTVMVPVDPGDPRGPCRVLGGRGAGADRPVGPGEVGSTARSAGGAAAMPVLAAEPPSLRPAVGLTR
jgi:hypothetical protein